MGYFFDVTFSEGQLKKILKVLNIKPVHWNDRYFNWTKDEEAKITKYMQQVIMKAVKEKLEE